MCRWCVAGLDSSRLLATAAAKSFDLHVVSKVTASSSCAAHRVIPGSRPPFISDSCCFHLPRYRWEILIVRQNSAMHIDIRRWVARVRLLGGHNDMTYAVTYLHTFTSTELLSRPRACSWRLTNGIAYKHILICMNRDLFRIWCEGRGKIAQCLGLCGTCSSGGGVADLQGAENGKNYALNRTV